MHTGSMRRILEIIDKHTDNTGVSPFAGTDHDVIFLNLTLDQVSEHSDDGQELIKLGCSVDEFDTAWCLYV